MFTCKAKIILLKIWSVIFLFLIADNAVAFECFSDSPSLEAGRDVFEAVLPRDLGDNEYQELEELLLSLNGRWEGTAEMVVCSGRDDDVITETVEYSIESNVKMRRSGDFLLKSTLTSREKKTKQHETIRLCLSRDRLATVCNVAVSDIELIRVSAGELAYLRKTPKKVGNNVRNVLETLTTFRKTGDASFEFEKLIYTQGKLKSIITWYLEAD